MPLLTWSTAAARAYGFTASTARTSLLAIVHYTSPYVTAYPFTSAGIGTKMADPATALGTSSWAQSVSYTTGTIAIGQYGAAPAAYPFTVAGFGTKYANPSYPGVIYGSGFNPAGNVWAAVSDSWPYIHAWPWSAGFGTKYSNSAQQPAQKGNGLAWTPSGNAVAFALDANDRILAWTWSSGWGTRIGSPATVPGSGFISGVSFHPSGNDVVFSHGQSNYQSATAYPWSSGFGTKYADPTATNSGANGVAFNPSGTHVALANDNSAPRVYAWSSGLGTLQSSAISTAGIPHGIAFSADGKNVAIAHETSPYLSVYPFTTNFGTKYANPATLPTGYGNNVVFN